MAQEAGMKMAPARRAPGSRILTPSVVHLKLDHYAALLEEKNGRYRLKDPTFGSEYWISREALDHEASGAFLIFRPASGLPPGWHALPTPEWRTIHGKGAIACVTGSGGAGSGNPTALPPLPKDSCGGGSSNSGGPSVGGCTGMAGYILQRIPCSLVIQDSPVGYAPAFGPVMNFRVSYGQRTGDQPASMLFSNFGPSWSGEFSSYLEDNTFSPNSPVTVHLRNGGFVKLLAGAQDITSVVCRKELLFSTR